MIFIRRAFPEDANQLTQITLASKRHWGYPEKWIQLWLPALTISPEYISDNEVWMGVEDDKSVAYYSLILPSVIARALLFLDRSNPQHDEGLLRRGERPPRNICATRQCRCDIDSLWLDNLWVLPENIGQGIGRQLFKHALERSRERGASVLKIEADPNAQSFYEKMGAHKVGEHHGEIHGQPRILPILEINI